MITFKNNNLTYIPSVDLTTLGNTFNTLEQGHKEAVKAASDLEITVANLPMNEDEDGFKQQLVNEIKNTIDENTIYGNSYGALDDLIIKIGNIKSDGRVIGRLRNQAAKKEYDAKVDAMPITEGMKQMYKEQNPYHYEDGEIDERTGRYLPGELWKPTTNPVATVPENEIQNAMQVYRDYYAEKGMFEAELYSGVVELIKNLRAAEKKIFVATSKPEVYAKQILERKGILNLFDFVGGSDLEEKSRVEKCDVVKYVLESNGISDEKEKCILIGDRHYDVDGAHSAGIKCAGILWGFGTKEEFENCGADFIFEFPKNVEVFLIQK